MSLLLKQCNDVISDFKEFLDKISPLYNSGKLGAILIQLPSSLSIKVFQYSGKIFRQDSKKTRRRKSK